MIVSICGSSIHKDSDENIQKIQEKFTNSCEISRKSLD